MAEAEHIEGYTAIPNQLIAALGGENGSTYSVVLFIARHTIGRQVKIGDTLYRVKEVCLSYDEFARGRRKPDGSRMQDTSGLKYDDAIERGITKAVAHGFIEIVSTIGQRGVRVYTITDKFWLAANFTTAIKMLADPRIAESATARKILAVGEQNPRSALENPSSSAREIQAAATTQPAQEEAGRASKQREEHRRENIEETKPPSLPAPEDSEITGQDLDALQQRQVAERALQKLLVEQEQLSAVLPSQRGWGAAQGRLRSIAREIEHYQALATPAAQAAATGKAASAQARRSPTPPPPASATSVLSEQATRRQRLTTLQDELAHLKKTPSMQLLARRRIPHLEAEIKQLIAEMSPG